MRLRVKHNPGFCGATFNNGGVLPQAVMFAGGNEGAGGVAKDSVMLFQSPAALTPGSKPAEEELARGRTCMRRLGVGLCR